MALTRGLGLANIASPELLTTAIGRSAAEADVRVAYAPPLSERPSVRPLSARPRGRGRYPGVGVPALQGCCTGAPGQWPASSPRSQASSGLGALPVARARPHDWKHCSVPPACWPDDDVPKSVVRGTLAVDIPAIEAMGQEDGTGHARSVDHARPSDPDVYRDAA